MAWPLTPKTTYNPGAVPSIKGADLNDFQKAINYAYDGKYTFRALKMDGVGGNDVSLSAPTDGTLDLQSPSLTETNPRVVTRRANGDPVFVIDHLGYPLGQNVNILKQDWTIPVVESAAGLRQLADPRWIGNTSANASIANQNGDDVYAGPSAKMICGTANNNYAEIGTTLSLWTSDAGRMVLVLLFDFLATAPTDANQKWMHGFGGTNINPEDATVPLAQFYRNGNQNWFARWNDGAHAITSQDLGVAPDGFLFQRMRIEIHGRLTPFGVAAVEGAPANTQKIRWFIDGVRRHTVGFGLGGASIASVIGGHLTGAPVGRGYCGPVIYAWNLHETADLL